MAENKLLPWAQTGTANVLSDDAYAADVATGGLYGDGVKTGQASSQQANKTWRQATAPGSGLGQFLVDNLGVDVTDSDTPATFSSRIANAVLKLAQISPFNQSFAAAIGGYRKYAIVSDSSGNYWVSTADQNTTVPGASGANWQSLFDGYATQSWANGQFLQLATTATQTITGSVTFSSPITRDAPAGQNAQLQFTLGGHIRWASGRDAAAETGTSTGSNFVIARFNNSGNYIDNPLVIDRETGVVSANLGMTVPDITDFTGKNALNAKTAEARYVRNHQIPGSQWPLNSAGVDAAGRFATLYYNNEAASIDVPSVGMLPTAGTITGGTYTKTPMNDGTGRSVLVQNIYLGLLKSDPYVAFPIAVNDPKVSFGCTTENGSKLSEFVNVQLDSNNNPMISNNGATLHMSAGAEDVVPSGWGAYVWMTVTGVV